MNYNETLKITRPDSFSSSVVFIDGLEGCGKTLFSALISSFDRVEKLTYSYEIEHICTLNFLNKIESSTCSSLIQMWTDLILYNTMMSREVNFRPSDLSSIFKHNRKFQYIKRLFNKGDEHIPSVINNEKPILALTVHKLISCATPIFESLGNRVRFIEIVRHPLYMIIQQSLNNEKLINSVRDFVIYFDYNGINVPWYTKGWEKEFLSLNPIEKSIVYIDKMTDLTNSIKTNLDKKNHLILTIPFEKFVIKPEDFMNKIADHMGSSITKSTLKELKKQNVPRQKYSDGLPLEIYKRCGWEKPDKDLNELQEFQKRRDFVEQGVRKKYIELLDRLSAKYEIDYLNKKLINNGKY